MNHVQDEMYVDKDNLQNYINSGFKGLSFKNYSLFIKAYMLYYY